MPALEEKLKEFGTEGETYKKKSADMKLLTEIENKIKAKQPLAKDELIFLYEINSPIEGFGYEKDPRIDEIKKTRNSKEDAPIVFECRPEQIAWKPENVDENTKAYIGELTLDNHLLEPTDMCHHGEKFLFRFRKPQRQP